MIYTHYLRPLFAVLGLPFGFSRISAVYAPVRSSVALAVCMRLAATGIKPEPCHNKSNKSVI